MRYYRFSRSKSQCECIIDLMVWMFGAEDRPYGAPYVGRKCLPAHRKSLPERCDIKPCCECFIGSFDISVKLQVRVKISRVEVFADNGNDCRFSLEDFSIDDLRETIGRIFFFRQESGSS